MPIRIRMNPFDGRFATPFPGARISTGESGAGGAILTGPRRASGESKETDNDPCCRHNNRQAGAPRRDPGRVSRQRPGGSGGKGCIDYAAHIDATGIGPFQAKFGPDTFAVIESWESPEALAAHVAAPHMAAYGKKTRDLIASRAIHVLSAID